MGKYIRHGIAVLVSALLTFLITLTGAVPDPDQVQGAAEGVASVLAPGIMLVAYAWVEKFLKRFRFLDTEGWIDRTWLKAEAEDPSAETRQLTRRQST